MIAGISDLELATEAQPISFMQFDIWPRKPMKNTEMIQDYSVFFGGFRGNYPK
jgi:hypothetical protein